MSSFVISFFFFLVLVLKLINLKKIFFWSSFSCTEKSSRDVSAPPPLVLAVVQLLTSAEAGKRDFQLGRSSVAASLG